MNVNFGLFPDLEGKIKGRDRKLAYTRRALADLDGWLGHRQAAE
jgi:methylenetetrahydrofolate--tRNA-(uracil-5-)-methyltransferase